MSLLISLLSSRMGFQPRASMVQSRAPMVQSRAPMVQPRAPMVQPRAPMVQDLISLSAVLLYVLPVIGYAITSNFIHIKAFIGLFSTMVLGESIKHYIIKDISPRPKGAYDCNLWCNDGKQEGKPGMPSGHSSQATFFASFYYDQTTNEWIRAGLVLYALLVMISRYLKRCHTIPQIVTGALLGWTMSRCVR